MPDNSLKKPQLEKPLPNPDISQQGASSISSNASSHPRSSGAWWAPEKYLRALSSVPANVLDNKDRFGDIPIIDTLREPRTDHQKRLKQYWDDLRATVLEFDEVIEALRLRGMWQDEALELYGKESMADLEELSLRIALTSKKLHDGLVDLGVRRGFRAVQKNGEHNRI
jgi:hypothetical protein